MPDQPLLRAGQEPPKAPFTDDPDARGPEGTVPVVVFDVEEYLALVGDQVPEDPADVDGKPPDPTSLGYYYSEWRVTQSTTAFHGLGGTINIWDVADLETGDHVNSQTAAYRGSGSGLQTVETGSRQWQSWNSGAPTLFVYYTTNNYASSGDWIGGYNASQKGWCQYSSTWYPGAQLSASTAGGTQIVMYMKTEKAADGWWVYAINEWIGYYPTYKNTNCSSTPSTYLFATSGMRNEASVLTFYGEVYDHLKPDASDTDMGSGEGYSAGYGYAAFFSDITGKHSTSSTWYGFNSLTGTRATTVTDANCYTLQTPQSNNSFYYGGKGAEWAYCD